MILVKVNTFLSIAWILNLQVEDKRCLIGREKSQNNQLNIQVYKRHQGNLLAGDSSKQVLQNTNTNTKQSANCKVGTAKHPHTLS